MTTTSTVPTRPALGLVAGRWTAWREPIVARQCALCGEATIYSDAVVCVDCSVADTIRAAEEAVIAYGQAGLAYAARTAPAFYGPQPRPVAIVISRRRRGRGAPIRACAVYADGTVLGWYPHTNLQQWAASEANDWLLKVLWTKSRADGQRVAAELDRLGLPRYRRVYRW